jgi:AmmeMemoRadiSam system protein B
MTAKHPKMRAVNAFPVTYSGNKMICLQDTSGLAHNTVVIPENIFFIVSMLDGENSVQDIQTAYIRQYGDLLFSERIQGVIDELDKNFFIEGKRFETHKTALKAGFRESETRLFSHPGDMTDDEPVRLGRELQSYFSHPDGPGDEVPEIPSGFLAGILLPHIDYGRGGPCYAWGYKCLEAFHDAETIIILGVNHMSGESPFSVTAKSFETPLGLMDTDKDVVQALVERCDQDLLEGEFYHRNEHSIELQSVWLKFLFGQKEDVRIVPVLCSGFDRFFDKEVSPLQDERVRDFVDGLKKTIAASGKRICLMASVDLSHMGPQFGDDRPVSPGVLSDIRDADLKTLRHVEALDKEGFWENVALDENRRNICGLSAIYTFLSTMEAREGKLLKYAQWHDESGWGCVTFASMVFCG